MRPAYVGDGARVLDFDCENRPLSYLGQDFTTSEITAIAWAFIPPEGKKVKVSVSVLGVTCQHGRCRQVHNGDSFEDMLCIFREQYERADLLTGHNIRTHDLRILNGMYVELGMPPLPPKLTEDTYRDLHKKSGVSGSQESLAAMLGVGAPKVSMAQVDWRTANRLTPEGIAKARLRCVGDVLQHVELRRELLDRGWLHGPRVWAG